jgi:hypothetical protein
MHGILVYSEAFLPGEWTSVLFRIDEDLRKYHKTAFVCKYAYAYVYVCMHEWTSVLFRVDKDFRKNHKPAYVCMHVCICVCTREWACFPACTKTSGSTTKLHMYVVYVYACMHKGMGVLFIIEKNKKICIHVYMCSSGRGTNLYTCIYIYACLNAEALSPYSNCIIIGGHETVFNGFHTKLSPGNRYKRHMYPTCNRDVQYGTDAKLYWDRSREISDRSLELGLAS